jgi:hypothetical protein
LSETVVLRYSSDHEELVLDVGRRGLGRARYDIFLVEEHVCSKEVSTLGLQVFQKEAHEKRREAKKQT